MKDRECVVFLQRSLGRLGLAWGGFRNVHGQVCKRVRRRMAALQLSDLTAYEALLEAEPAEWAELERLCAVTISRFYRDGPMWQLLRDEVLPRLARAALASGEDALRCWSIGCASGEEPYTLSIVCSQLALPLPVRILATDIGERVLQRARAACYAPATLGELPLALRERAFEPLGEGYQLRAEYRARVELRRSDLRRELPPETFRLMLCRNSVFSYFDESEQRRALERLATRLAPGGVVVLGSGERLPAGAAPDALTVANERPHRAGWRCLPRTPA